MIYYYGFKYVIDRYIAMPLIMSLTMSFTMLYNPDDHLMTIKFTIRMTLNMPHIRWCLVRLQLELEGWQVATQIGLHEQVGVTRMADRWC